MNITRRLTAATILSSLLAGGALVASQPLAGAHDTATPHADELSAAQRQVIRESTHQFKDIDAALAAGYLPTEECSAIPGVGGMGHHYVNPALIGDGRIDPTLPEVLLYVPAANGNLELAGVEYLVFDSDQDLATDADRPTLMGHGFDGPMEGHEPGMPVHYDLHAWVFTDNPAGNLAAWNPKLTCGHG